jgi:hypothetical protein
MTIDDPRTNEHLLSPEASMVLALWDGTHGARDNSAMDFETQYNAGLVRQEDPTLHDYERKWREAHPSRGEGRREIPLFQLAAELVVSRLFAPGTYNASSASWERSETTWDVSLGRTDRDPEDDAPDSEWVETMAGWEEIPIARWQTFTPGGMAAYRILFAFGEGKFVSRLPVEEYGRYVPFRWSRDDCPGVNFRFEGGRREPLSDALVGGSDYGPRSAWIKRLVSEVDFQAFRFDLDSPGSSAALLFRAHEEFFEELEMVVRACSTFDWALGPAYRLDAAEDPDDLPF